MDEDKPITNPSCGSVGGTAQGNRGYGEVQQDNSQECSVVRPVRATESGILHSRKKLPFVCIFQTSPIWLLSLDKKIYRNNLFGGFQILWRLS